MRKVGKQVFFGKTAACSSCHRVGSEGALIGPDLTKVGKIRAPRDLIESVIFPSASFARGYESYTIVTSSGQVYSGLDQPRDDRIGILCELRSGRKFASPGPRSSKSRPTSYRSCRRVSISC